MLRNLEKSRLGRAWVAIREDQLAATCMGIGAPRVKMAAFAVSSGLAGLAGCLFATKLTNTADPNAYDFSRSIITLCCVILGGLGSIRGTLLGVFLLVGFDIIAVKEFDKWLQNLGVADAAADWARSMSPDNTALPETMRRLLTFNNWKLMIFGLALVLMMRFRPEGLLPSCRVQQELHHGEAN
jgi:branched-chain amino acid transport system permease protein